MEYWSFWLETRNFLLITEILDSAIDLHTSLPIQLALADKTLSISLSIPFSDGRLWIVVRGNISCIIYQCLLHELVFLGTQWSFYIITCTECAAYKPKTWITSNGSTVDCTKCWQWSVCRYRLTSTGWFAKYVTLCKKASNLASARAIIKVSGHQHQWFPGVSQVVTM